MINIGRHKKETGTFGLNEIGILSVVVDHAYELPENPDNDLVVYNFVDCDGNRKYKYITFKEMLKLSKEKSKFKEIKQK